MIFECPQCHVKNDVSDLGELHEGLKLICLACDHVTVVHFGSGIERGLPKED